MYAETCRLCDALGMQTAGGLFFSGACFWLTSFDVMFRLMNESEVF